MIRTGERSTWRMRWRTDGGIAVTTEYGRASRGVGRIRQYGIGERLPVTCWCERDIVHVTPEEVREGRTRTCGRLHCNEEGVTQ